MLWFLPSRTTMGYYPGQARIWHFPQRQGVASLLCSPSVVERQISKWWGSIEPLKPSWADSVIFLYLCLLICTQGYLCLNNRGYVEWYRIIPTWLWVIIPHWLVQAGSDWKPLFSPYQEKVPVPSVKISWDWWLPLPVEMGVRVVVGGWGYKLLGASEVLKC